MIQDGVFPSQYDQIVDVVRPHRAYLVGGAVRDALLNRPIHDLDFALPKDTIPVAKKVADQLGGGFFVLDSERDTCRVILKDQEGQRLVVDFTLFQGEGIEEDLAARDFTITSMALDLDGDNELIDPFHGTQDLKEGLIRATSESALEDDPVRCLRAVRLAAQLGFHILPETKEQIRRSQHHLVEVSPERKRDELFRILAGPNQSAAVLSLQILDLYPNILPGEYSQQQSKRLRNLEALWSLFLKEHEQERAASWPKGTLIHRLGRYREKVREFLNLELVPERTIYQLTFLVSLLCDYVGSDENLTQKQIIDQIPLSNQEAGFLLQGIKATRNWLRSSQEKEVNEAVDVYRYFNHYGQAGVAAVFIGLGEIMNDQTGDQGQDHWIDHLDQARFFLEGYWERHSEWVDPPLLVDGNDIQRELRIAPGPEIGSLLELLREEQVRSGLTLKSEGLAFLKQHLALSDRRDP